MADVLVEKRGTTAWVTLNRPDVPVESILVIVVAQLHDLVAPEALDAALAALLARRDATLIIDGSSG